MRLYIAGTESVVKGGSYTIDIPNDCYILNSFYYTDDKVTDKILQSVGRENYLLDSGAFTFRMKGLKGMDIGDFVKQYIDFINRHSIKYFFEMDIDMTYEELDRVKYFRSMIEDGTGIQSIPVWHKTRGIEEWYDILDKYEYVAIGGITSALDDRYADMIKLMVKKANKNNVKVHGLGYNRKDMLDFDFFSCDATSWNGGKYGNV